MYVLFDIGGTKTRISVSRDLCSFSEPTRFDTPNDFKSGIEQIGDAARTLCDGAPITAMAGGIRGFLNREHTKVISDAVLTDWVEKPITATLKAEFGMSAVYLENDSAVAGLGEAHFGAGKGYDIVAYLTVSTGVGGARIDHGYIEVAGGNFEPGKSIIDIDNTQYPQQKASSLEEFVSGSALERRSGKKPYEIPQEDPVWNELAEQLAVGIKNTIMYWSPDVVVLGGAMILGDPRILCKDIAKHTKRVLDGLVPAPPILDARLGDFGGLYGAMARIRQEEAKNTAQQSNN